MKKHFRSQFLRSLAILTSGSFLAQVIIVICSPIMTRLYSTEQIGEYTLVLTAVGLFGSVICARYDMAIVAEEDEKKVISLAALSLLISIVLSIIVSIGYSIYYLYKGYTVRQILFCCFCILILLVLVGLGNILISYNNRCKEYKLMTSVNLIRAVAKQGIMIIGGLTWPTAWILIISEIGGTIFGVKRQSESLMKKTDHFKDFKKVTWNNLIEVGVKHKKQALFSTPALFANNFSYSSINLFIVDIFGKSTLGLYSVSYRLLGLPLTLISTNVSRLYFEEAARQFEKEGHYDKILIRTTLIMIAISIPMTAVLMLMAPQFCSVFFGKEYYTAGIYLRYLAPMFGVRFIVSPISVGMIISQKQQYELIFQIGFVIMSLISYVATRLFDWSIDYYLVLISCLYSLVYIVFYIALIKISKEKEIQND